LVQTNASSKLHVIDDVLITGVVTASSFSGTGGYLTLGSADDGSLTSSGALNTFTTNTKIVQ